MRKIHQKEQPVLETIKRTDQNGLDFTMSAVSDFESDKTQITSKMSTGSSDSGISIVHFDR